MYVTLASTPFPSRKPARSGSSVSSSRTSVWSWRVNWADNGLAFLLQGGFGFLNGVHHRDHRIQVGGFERLLDHRLRIDDHRAGTAAVERACTREQHAQPERCDEIEVGEVDDGRLATR